MNQIILFQDKMRNSLNFEWVYYLPKSAKKIRIKSLSRSCIQEVKYQSAFSESHMGSGYKIKTANTCLT